MLAFDIETLGLDMCRDAVTCIAIYDKDRGIEKVWDFVTNQDANPAKLDEFVKYMNEADELAAFNGVRFDIPFLQIHFGLDNDLIQSWILKCFDLFEYFKSVHGLTFKLDLLLFENGLTQKIADGKQAIEFARQGETEKLKKYCLEDARLTWQVCQLEKLKIPKSNFPCLNSETDIQVVTY